MSTKKAFCWTCSAALDRSYTVVGDLAYCSAHLSDARARAQSLNGPEVPAAQYTAKPARWTSPAGYIPDAIKSAPTPTAAPERYPARGAGRAMNPAQYAQHPAALRPPGPAGFAEKDSIRVLCGPYVGRVGHITSLTSMGRTAHCVLDGIDGVMAFNTREIELAATRIPKQPSPDEYQDQVRCGTEVRCESSTKWGGIHGVVSSLRDGQYTVDFPAFNNSDGSPMSAILSRKQFAPVKSPF